MLFPIPEDFEWVLPFELFFLWSFTYFVDKTASSTDLITMPRLFFRGWHLALGTCDGLATSFSYFAAHIMPFRWPELAYNWSERKQFHNAISWIVILLSNQGGIVRQFLRLVKEQTRHRGCYQHPIVWAHSRGLWRHQHVALCLWSPFWATLQTTWFAIASFSCKNIWIRFQEVGVALGMRRKAVRARCQYKNGAAEGANSRAWERHSGICVCDEATFSTQDKELKGALSLF